MTYDKHTWIDRVVQYPDRREIHHENGVIETVDIKRAEGTVTKEGTQLNAANFNDLEDRISGGFSSVDNSIFDINNNVGTITSTVETLSDTMSTKQDKLTAGSGISIENNVISISLTDADTQEY